MTVLIGDVCRSREAADRRVLHTRLLAALDRVSERTHPREPIRITVGDEFQGVFDDVGSAIDAAMRLRLELLPEIDTRYGLGRGSVTRLDAHTQDGPAWWAAREAIDWVRQAEDRAATRHVRTAYRSATEASPDPDAVNAALLCRDHLVGSWDDRSQRIMKGLMDARSQAQLATAEGISASAVSQRVRSDGLGIVLTASSWLAGLS